MKAYPAFGRPPVDGKVQCAVSNCYRLADVVDFRDAVAGYDDGMSPPGSREAPAKPVVGFRA